MGVWPWDAPDAPRSVTVRWEEGSPASIDGETGAPADLFRLANAVAGAHGVGIGLHTVENRFVGIKSRGIYEAPGMELLGRAYEFLLQFVLDRRARQLFDSLSAFVSNQIYQGYWLDLGTTSALAALEPIRKLATGAVTVRLYKGTITFETADDTPEAMPHSLYTDDSSMEALGSYDHADAEGFLKVLQVSARNVGSRQYPQMGR